MQRHVQTRLSSPALVAPLYTAANSEQQRVALPLRLGCQSYRMGQRAARVWRGAQPHHDCGLPSPLSAARIPPHSAGDEIYNLEDVSRMLTKLNRTDLLTATHSGVKG
eukprot:scaffold86264_cov57-Phaeocystis_antarctica.AAC.1